MGYIFLSTRRFSFFDTRQSKLLPKYQIHCMLLFLLTFSVFVSVRNGVVTTEKEHMTQVSKSVCFLRMIHTRCRNGLYPRSTVKRVDVPIERIPWEVEWPEYNPEMYTSASVIGQPWADPDINNENFHPNWNQLENYVDRESYIREYSIENGLPLNVIGRTGLRGRGNLGRWGPNHAADPIVTRWKRDKMKKIIYNDISNKPVLQFVSIKRRDTGEWAIPGGMVDPGESVSATLKREFMEEALNYLDKDDIEKSRLKQRIQDTFVNGTEVYKGYVDDPRNTDNAWIESLAMHFHDENGTSVGSVPLQAGDDAVHVAWKDMDQTLYLYANHVEFFKEIVQKLDAHW